jgi:hypothetical protein
LSRNGSGRFGALKSDSTHHFKLYEKLRNKVNNMNKIAKENFENNLDHILLD